jgi:threonylcarbamoyladenosine tRNA methylthiotransferase MtaB
MHRRYRPWHYEAKVQAIRDTVPEAAIGADVMVGFPGETDALFEETLRFVERQPFTYLHLFPFSARPGTPAWQLQRESPVAGVAVRERMAQLRAVMAEKNLRYRERFVGRTLSAVTIQCESAGTGTQAVSDNFLAIEMPAWYSANRMLQVRVRGVTATGLRGTADPSHAHSPAERPSPEEGLPCAHHVSPHHVL